MLGFTQKIITKSWHGGSKGLIAIGCFCALVQIRPRPRFPNNAYISRCKVGAKLDIAFGDVRVMYWILHSQKVYKAAMRWWEMSFTLASMIRKKEKCQAVADGDTLGSRSWWAIILSNTYLCRPRTTVHYFDWAIPSLYRAMPSSSFKARLRSGLSGNCCTHAPAPVESTKAH